MLACSLRSVMSTGAVPQRVLASLDCLGFQTRLQGHHACTVMQGWGRTFGHHEAKI